MKKRIIIKCTKCSCQFSESVSILLEDISIIKCENCCSILNLDDFEANIFIKELL